MFYIYGLRASSSDEYRYVGRTTQPNKRLYEHRTMTARGNAYLNPRLADWIDATAEALVMDILEAAPRFGRQHEQRWIDKLTNNDGSTS